MSKNVTKICLTSIKFYVIINNIKVDDFPKNIKKNFILKFHIYKNILECIKQ